MLGKLTPLEHHAITPPANRYPFMAENINPLRIDIYLREKISNHCKSISIYGRKYQITANRYPFTAENIKSLQIDIHLRQKISNYCKSISIYGRLISNDRGMRYIIKDPLKKSLIH